MDPGRTDPADTVRPLGDGRFEMKVVIDAECHRGLERLRGLLSHVDLHMTLGQLVRRLAREGLDRHDPGRPWRRPRAGSRSASGAGTSAAKEEAASGDAAEETSAQPAMNGSAPARSSAGHDRGGVTSAPKSKRSPGDGAGSATPACEAGTIRHFAAEGGARGPDAPAVRSASPPAARTAQPEG